MVCLSIHPSFRGLIWYLLSGNITLNDYFLCENSRKYLVSINKRSLFIDAPKFNSPPKIDEAILFVTNTTDLFPQWKSIFYYEPEDISITLVSLFLLCIEYIFNLFSIYIFLVINIYFICICAVGMMVITDFVAILMFHH